MRLGWLGRSEPRRVDPGRRDLDSLVRNSFEQERVTGAVGRSEEEIDARDRLAPLPAAAEAPVGVAERDRLPDGEHEPEAELRLEQRGAVAEGDADLGRMHDVRTFERGLEPQVAVSERQGAEVAGPAARQPVAERAHGLHREVERREVEGVRPGREHADVVAVGKQLPRAELPRDSRSGPAGRRRAACSSAPQRVVELGGNRMQRERRRRGRPRARPAA